VIALTACTALAAQAADCGPYADLPALSGPPLTGRGLTTQDRREMRAAAVTRCLINNERAAGGPPVPPLRHNPLLSAFAVGHSRDLVRRS
jgi:uncharacterized protein YkwD